MRDFAIGFIYRSGNFAAKYNLRGRTGNMTLAELLDIEGPEDRADFESVSLGYTETFGRPRCARRSATTIRWTRNLLCFAGAAEGI